MSMTAATQLQHLSLGDNKLLMYVANFTHIALVLYASPRLPSHWQTGGVVTVTTVYLLLLKPICALRHLLKSN